MISDDDRFRETDAGDARPIITEGPLAGARSACGLHGVERRRPVARLGPWANQTRDIPQVGAVPMHIDHALGETMYATRASGRWSLTTDLTLDVLVPPPWPGTYLHVMSSVSRRDPTGGLVRAELRDDGGRLLISSSGWTRYVTGTHETLGRALGPDPAALTRQRSRRVRPTRLRARPSLGAVT